MIRTALRELPWLKRLVILATALLAIVGIYDALRNLPVVSGCAFYADCQSESYRKPPGAMGLQDQ